MKRPVTAMIAASGAACVLVAFVWTFASKDRATRSTSDRPMAPSAAGRSAHRPKLYCDFYDFMRADVVVSFDFDVDRRNPNHPVFSELFVLEPDNTRTEFGTPEMPSPIWTYAIDDGTPTITAANNETRIVLYGLDLASASVLWIEAGIRSARYRNLEGKCRQAYLARQPALRHSGDMSRQ